METTKRLLALLLGSLMLAPVLPVAAAGASNVGLGLNAGSVSDATKAGAKPAYASFWVGEWTSSSGWGALEGALRTAKTAGVTPVVYWYYWGDSISPWCVDNGCSGRARWEWEQMTRTLATKIREQMGGATTIVVLENEFNKNGMDGSYAWKFDGYLAERAHELKATPGVKVVLGFGGWGEGSWNKFPKALAASDLVGFQVMRASTKDSESSYRGAPDRMAQLADAANAASGGKGSFVYDLALSSYDGWHWSRVQDETLKSILDRRAEFAGKGVLGIVYRELRDNPSMGTKNYYGVAEQYWGFQDRYGTAKPAWRTWVAAHAGNADGGSGGGSDGAAFAPKFAPKPGNEWWIEVGVTSDERVTSVCASVDGGACQPLSLRSWGAWAASIRAPEGSTVQFTATGSSGAKATSGGYAWPSATPVTGGGGGSSFAATFTPDGGNEWWIQVKVEGNEGIRSVCASVDGRACAPLTLRSWGAWAESLHAPPGSHVVFRATATSGATATSSAYAWPPGSTSQPAFTATFRPHGGNEWWVQAEVTGSESVRSVCASVNGGACQPLSLRSWGAWADSLHAPSGSRVVFKATAESGATATSSAYAWPMR